MSEDRPDLSHFASYMKASNSRIIRMYLCAITGAVLLGFVLRFLVHA